MKVTDSTGGTAVTYITPSCSITIAPPPLTASCAAATTGQVGVPYSSAITASGGTAPYTFALNSGSLPGGLSLNPATGAITGTPTTAGAFTFTVKVTDSTGGTALTYHAELLHHHRSASVDGFLRGGDHGSGGRGL